MISRASAWSSAVIIAATCVVNSGISAVHAQSQQAPPPSQQQPPAPPPGQQQPPDQQTPQGQPPTPPGQQPTPEGQQPPTQDPAAPTSILLPPGPAVPILSAGIPAVVSTQPGRAFERPYRGMFGGSAIGPGQPGLFLTLGTYGAYDDNVLATQPGGSVRSARAGGFYTGASGDLDYTRIREKFTLHAGGSGELRYYELFDDTTTSLAAHAATAFRLGRRNSISATQTVSRTELYRMAGLPGLEAAGSTPVADAEFNINPRTRLASLSFVSYSHELTGTSRLTADYTYRSAQTSALPIDVIGDTAGELDLQVHAGGASYERQMGRHSRLNLGYHRESAVYEAEDGSQRNVLINNLNIGGGYVRPLSFSRRTTISLSAGTGMISREAIAGAPPVDYFRVTGTAAVEHEFGRTWTIVGNYTRGTQFIEGFADPFFLDAGRILVSGLLRPRVEFVASVGYTDGRLSLSAQENPYSSLIGTVRVGYSLSTRLELAGEYAYRQYQFSNTVGLPVTVPQDVGRNSVIIRLGYWLPIFRTR
jgi:hypothetical protein